MSHVDGWPMVGQKNSVIVAQQPMRGRENRSGWCIGTKVKNLSKMSWRLEAVSMILFYIGQIIDIMDLRRQPV